MNIYIKIRTAFLNRKQPAVLHVIWYNSLSEKSSFNTCLFKFFYPQARWVPHTCTSEPSIIW